MGRAVSPLVISWQPEVRYFEALTEREAYDLLRALTPGELASACVRRERGSDLPGDAYLLSLEVIYGD